MDRREVAKLKIEFDVRIADWRAGALSDDYVYSKLQTTLYTLEKTKLKPGKLQLGILFVLYRCCL